MLRLLGQAARRLLEDFGRSWRPAPPPIAGVPQARPVDPGAHFRPLDRLVLTDGVSRTLFEEYGQHRAGPRGLEETGWVLLGHRFEKEAVALATLPAGTKCEAGVAHVRFNSMAQVVASRILRREDRQLGILGVVHTHPGSLRHPSNGDFQGDREWVRLLRGGEGVFGIGTADAKNGHSPLVAFQPKRHSQCYLGLRFSWYALGEGDRAYRPLTVRLTIGPDLARPLHQLWPTIEAHAERLDLLCKRLSRVHIEGVFDEQGEALHVNIPLEGPEECIRVVLRAADVEYYLIRKGQWLAGDQREPQVDRGVYLMLAALAREEE